MESLSRPPHRRKHSAASFAGRNPYDDVFLSRGGRGGTLEAHEYSEIFAGSSPSSIPVLDLSGLDERVGLGDGEISVLDYGNIFGGLRNDDVAAAYEELVNGSVKRAKPRTLADSQRPLRHSGSIHSSGKARRSSEETSNQSVDGVKQQFNVSFNKTNQRDSDASNGKTHIAQLHSVPGFTHFVDETPRQQKEEDRKPLPLLKRDVSRTWSFSGEVEDVKGKRGVSSDKSCTPDASQNRNEANAKSHSSKVLQSSNCPSNPSNSKDPKRARALNSASKADASEKIPAACSPPFLEEEFDENSVAAASAAALKKAIEQAQESIRMAKLIMERKKAGHDNKSKIKSCGIVKDLNEETEIELRVYGSKENHSRKEREDLDATCKGVDGNRSPSLSENDKIDNAEVKAVQEKVEVAKEHGDGFCQEGSLFTFSFSGGERICLGEKVQLDKNGETVEAAKILRKETECRTETSESETGGNNNGVMLSMNKLVPDVERMETGKETLEQRDVAVSHAGPEVLVAERGLDKSHMTQDLEKSVEEPEQYQVTFDHAKGPEVAVERLDRVLDTSQITLELEKVVVEDVENWGTSLEEEVTEEIENDVADEQKHGKESEGREEVDVAGRLTVLKTAFNYFLMEACNLMRNEVPEQEEMERKHNDAPECKESGHNDGRGNEVRCKEAHVSFESKEPLEEEINVTELSVRPKIGRIGMKVEAGELEIDEKERHSHDGDDTKLPGEGKQDKIEERHENTSEYVASKSRFMEVEAGELEIDEKERHSHDGDDTKLPGEGKQDKIEERHENTSEYVASESRFMEASNLSNFGRAQKETFWDVQKTNNIIRETERIEEDNIGERREETFEYEANERQAMEAYYFAEAQKNVSFWDVEETDSTLRGTGRSEKDHNEARDENPSENEADETRLTEADNFAEVPKNDAFWDVEQKTRNVRGTGTTEEDHDEEQHKNTSDHEVKENQVMEKDSFTEVQKNNAFWDLDETTVFLEATGRSEETDSTLRGTGRSEEVHNEERHENASVHEADEMRAAEADSFTEVQKNDAFWDVDETNISVRATGRTEEHGNEERYKIDSEHEADESQTMEASEFSDVQKNETIWDVEETRSEEHDSVFEFQEAANDENADEAVDANTGIASTIINETQETSGVDFNSTAEQSQETVNNNMESDTLPGVGGSQIDTDMETEKPFQLEDNDMSGIESLPRIAAEGIFVESKQSDASEGFASDSKTESVVITKPDSRESSPEAEHGFKTDGGIRGTTQNYADNNLSDAVSSDSRNEESDLTDEGPVLEQTSESDEGSVSTSSPREMDKLSTHEWDGCAENAKDMTYNKEEIVDEPEISNERKCTEEQSEGVRSPLQSKPKEAEKFMEAKRNERASSNIENNGNPSGTFATGEKDAKENVQNFDRHEQQQRIEAIKRAREREKERLAVERAIREARERAFAEAREKAEKAAAERAAAEVQQRVTAEAQEKLDKASASKQQAAKASASKQPVEKASAVKQPADKASTDAKLRAERAAVERALAEVRGRALEKAMSQKTSSETRTMADRNSGLKHSFSSSDLEESAQRRKARLERHQRIMERAAKALAEKNMRDLLAQREQMERNRLAESLDADVKRWATGKEGNLRALLSTLQYILGRDSGWQPIPLTEMVTTVAVKKAYRKATLYVHPDKVQQRGASIRQKYICEKVFDLLKAAWNKFNSEER